MLVLTQPPRTLTLALTLTPNPNPNPNQVLTQPPRSKLAGRRAGSEG